MKIKRQKGLENLAWALAALLILCSSLAAALPDLIVDSVSSPSVINTSANVTIEANISNIGDSSANNFMNLFIVSPTVTSPYLYGLSEPAVYTGSVADQPTSALDSMGNLHMLWMDRRTGDLEIFYRMEDKNGNILIDDTQLTFSGTDAVRPSIAVDSNDKLHIAWQDRRLGSPQIFYKKLDPSLDDQDGSSATAAAITEVSDMHISINAQNEHGSQDSQPAIAVDNTQDVHIVWERTGDESIGYAKLDNDGNFIITDVRITEQYGILFHSVPSIGIDSNGNVHIAWNEVTFTCDYEVFYMMLNGSNWQPLINASQVSIDDCYASFWQKLAVDSSNNVLIVAADEGGLETNIFFTAFNPYASGLDGQPANLTLIAYFPFGPLLPDDGIYRTKPNMALLNDNAHIAFYDETTGDQELHLVVVGLYGNLLAQDTQMSNGAYVTTWTGWTFPSIAVSNSGDGYIMWTDYNPGQYSIFRSTYNLPQPRIFDQQLASANAGQAVNVPATLDTSGLVGSYNLFVITDSANSISEENESNNNLLFSLPVIQGADLVIDVLTVVPNESIISGAGMVVNATVRNAGIVDLSGPILVDFFVDDLFITSTIVDTVLTSGSSIIIGGMWQAIPGDHVIKAVVNPSGWIPEQDLGNNENSVALPYIIGPDLILTNISWMPNETIAALGSVINFNITMMNIGGSSVESGFYVAVSLNDVFVGNAYVPASVGSPILPNASRSVIFAWAVSVGNRTNLTANVDAYNYIFEQNESNNLLKNEFLLQVDLPDVIVSDVFVQPSPARVGNLLNFTATVTNIGAVTLYPDYYVQFLVNNAFVQNVYTTINIPPGASLNISTTVNYAGILGSHNLTANADAYNYFPELNELNNLRMEGRSEE